MTMAEFLPSNYLHTLLVDFATLLLCGRIINKRKEVKYWPFSLDLFSNVFGRAILVFFFSQSCFKVPPPPPTHTMFFPEGFQVREFFWVPHSVSQKLPWGIDPSWLQRHGVNWNSLPVSITSACTKRDVSTINLYLDSYIDFLQITFLITTCNSIVFVCDSIHSHGK